MELEPTNTEFHSDALIYGAIRPRALRANIVQLLQFHLLFSVQISFRLLSSSVATFILIEIFAVNHMSVAEWSNDTYGIHHWSVVRSSYRKLAWVGFEATNTEFCSDTLTDWVIRPKLALRANLVQLLQFNLLFSVQISFRVLPLVVATFIALEILHW